MFGNYFEEFIVFGFKTISFLTLYHVCSRNPDRGVGISWAEVFCLAYLFLEKF